MPRHHPTYRLHKPSGRAVIQWKPLYGDKRKYLVGKFNSPESLAEYAAILKQITDAKTAERPVVIPPRRGLVVGGLLAAFMEWTEATRDKQTYRDFKRAADALFDMYGAKPVDEFGPLALEQVRDSLVARGMSRHRVNRQVRRIRQAFKWGVARELVLPDTYAKLLRLEPLKRGWTKAPDHAAVEPVEWSAVERLLPFLSPTVADMVQVHGRAGMRSSEVCKLRASEIDRSGDVWVYRPKEHKTASKGKAKIVCFGPRAQKILQRHIDRGGEYLFSPAQAIVERFERRRQERKTKVYGKQKNQEPRIRRTNPFYRSAAYQRAIAYGFHRLARSLGAKEGCPKGISLRVWLQSFGVTYWHPHQLRHTRATQARASHGIEGAQAILGNTIQATQIYAEKSLELAKRIARETG